MKELLYIPSGKYVRFFSVPIPNTPEDAPYNSIETYMNQHNAKYTKNKYNSIEEVIIRVREGNFNSVIFDTAEIHFDITLDEDSEEIIGTIPAEYFELIEV